MLGRGAATATDAARVPTRRSSGGARGIIVAVRRALPVLALAMAGLLVAAASGALGGAVRRPASPARLRVDRFDAARAWADLRHQVALGPRPAGSAASRRLARWIRARLPHGRFERVPGGLRNVVGTLPGRRPAVVLAAHYDTKDLPRFVGAEDGAGGTAELLELARDLGRAHRSRRAPELRFVFFDGEESPDDSADFYSTGLRGSRAYARRHRGETRALVLLDFVADRNLSLPREQGSDPGLWSKLRAAARRVGAGRAFPRGTTGEVIDDHTPFTRRGVPAIDLIDFTYPCWHRTCDDLAHVSRRSLDMTGESVLELVRTTWR
jgi:glutaminyl-peptide cyclotransferase